MPNVLAQTTLPYLTGFPEDVSVNTWSFDIASTDESNLLEIASFLGVFYGGVMPYYSEVVDSQNFGVKIYDRADPEPRTPLFDTTGALAVGPGEGGLPEEVAVCLSFRGVLASGSPPARRRGRVYLGPLNGSAISLADAQNRVYVAQDFIDDIVSAYELAWAELTTAGNVHEVWSSAAGAGYTVVAGWVDNAFDTQRRRGVRANSRTTFEGPF